MNPSLHKSRSGMMAIDVLAAVAVLAIAMLVAAKMSTALTRHRTGVEKHRIEAQAKYNLAQFALAMPYDDVSAGRLQSVAQELDRDLAWNIDVKEEAEQKRISLRISSTKDSLVDRLQRPLVVHRFRLQEEAQP